MDETAMLIIVEKSLVESVYTTFCGMAGSEYFHS